MGDCKDHFPSMSSFHRLSPPPSPLLLQLLSASQGGGRPSSHLQPHTTNHNRSFKGGEKEEERWRRGQVSEATTTRHAALCHSPHTPSSSHPSYFAALLAPPVVAPHALPTAASLHNTPFLHCHFSLFTLYPPPTSYLYLLSFVVFNNNQQP